MGEICSFTHPISLPPLIFKFIFRPNFRLYSQVETTSMTTKTWTKILRRVIFEKNLHDSLKRSRLMLAADWLICENYKKTRLTAFDTS